MEMKELKNFIYQGEKVDIECKKAENSVLVAGKMQNTRERIFTETIALEFCELWRAYD